MLLFSFDCARKSMGVIVMNYNTTDFSKSAVLYADVWDLGDVRNAITTAPALRRHLDKLETDFGIPEKVLYEFQMVQNDKSRMVSVMLAYHYGSTSKVFCIPPSLKNKICGAIEVSKIDFETNCPVSSERKIRHGGKNKKFCDVLYQNTNTVSIVVQEFSKYSTTQYKANKSHTTAVFEWWASVHGLCLKHIPKKNLDDVADAFVQIMAHDVQNC